MNRYPTNSGSSSSSGGLTPSASASQSHSYYDELCFPYCEDVSNYDRITKIGQGTFG